jgi:putative hydrolase of the HAD superfamily
VSRTQPIAAVSFDAAGTLFGLTEAVGETYARLALRHGFAVTPEATGRGFRAAFAEAPPLVAPRSAPPAERLRIEQAWWRRIVHATLVRAGAEVADPASFDALFGDAFAHYARAGAWQLFDDVLPALEALLRSGKQLAVVSNFDGRLRGVLAGLGLDRFFAAVVLSSEAGAAKPDPAIFDVARTALGGGKPIEANACVHVGDSREEDALAAQAAGLVGVWLERRGRAAPGGEPIREGTGEPPSDLPIVRITDLRLLTDLLEWRVHGR